MKSELYTDEEINTHLLGKKEEGAQHEVAPPTISKADAENPPPPGGNLEADDLEKTPQ